MRKYRMFLVFILIFSLASCADAASINNFGDRKDSYIISSDKSVIIYYKTDNDGKLVELDVDRLLTIEEMMLYNPSIDFEYELEGFDGDIFMEPSNTCTDISNDVLIPINIEVGNTRYKFDDDDCRYETVDNHNEFKPGYEDEYLLTDTIDRPTHIKISIIVYNPNEIVNFVEIYEISGTYKGVGLYSNLINRDKDGFESTVLNYYKDITTFEQIYLKHQELEASLIEISGVATDINLMDLNSLTDINPLIEYFDVLYEEEIIGIEEMQEKIGITFETDLESVENEDVEDPEE